MKTAFMLAGLFFTTALFAQGDNEFAASAFYTQFKKIYADAQNGFVQNKGTRVLSDYPELTDEFKAKLNLPQADSARIVFPKNNNLPYALYFFEPAKSRLKTDQRALGLREAIGTAYAKMLFTKTETRVSGNDVYTDTWFFEKETDTDKKTALFRISEFPQGNKYYFTLEIRGRIPGATAPAP